MPSNLTGQIFGQYKLLELIDKGGMAIVYRAKQLNIDREVAIKIMAPALAKQENFVRRFKEEAERLAKLEHPHIVPIYDHDQHEQYLYMVLRLLSGGSLSNLISSDEPVALERIVRIVQQISSALAHAHNLSIIHSDLKPSNILLDDDGNAYLMDFGIAKLISETKGEQMSTLLGTPSYIAPEMWQDQNVDHRADIYSLGMVVYALLTGDLPFAKSSPFYLMYSHLHENLPKPSELRKSIPPELDAVVMKALSKTPEERYENVEAFANDFRDAFQKHTDAHQDDKSMLDASGVRSFRPEAKRDSRLDNMWIALERSSGHVYVTPDIDQLFEADTEKSHHTNIEDIWDELERPPTAAYDTRRLQDILEQIKKRQAFFGVRTQRVALPEFVKNQVEGDVGLLLIAVEPDSPADQAGFFLGDLLLSLDDVPLRHQDDLIKALNNERIGKVVKVKFVRTGHVNVADVELTERAIGKRTL